MWSLEMTCIWMPIAMASVFALSAVCLFAAKRFHHEIEQNAFLTSLAGLAASDILLRAPNNWNCLSEVCFCLLWVFAILTLGLFGAWLFRQFRFPLAAMSLAGCLGVLTGYFATAYDDSMYAYQCEYRDWPGWYKALTALAEPGAVVTGYDWYDDDLSEYNLEIAIGNSVAWSIVGIAIATPIYYVTRRYGAVARHSVPPLDLRHS